jgi:hypothetical protein
VNDASTAKIAEELTRIEEAITYLRTRLPEARDIEVSGFVQENFDSLFKIASALHGVEHGTKEAADISVKYLRQFVEAY